MTDERLRGRPRPAPPAVLLLSGPNLGLLGERQPEIYGTATLADHVGRAELAAGSGLEFEHLQSEHEADLIAAVHRARGPVAAIVVNAGALSHSSWALHDALATFDGVVVELHLSNPDAREPWRRRRFWRRWPTGPSPASAGSAMSSPSRPPRGFAGRNSGPPGA